MKDMPLHTLDELIDAGVIELGRGNVISKKDIAACPGPYPIYSSAKENDGKFGEYGKFMFDEELITWSVDGGGRLFHRAKHKFSVTNVGGTLRILNSTVLDYRYLYYALTIRHAEIAFDWVLKAHPSTIRKLYKDIPVPPLAEQHRIVANLDEAFDGIATAKANTEKNLQNARALFESHLQSVFTERGVGWGQKRLGDVVSRLTNGYVGPTRNIYQDSGVPYLLARHVRSNRLLFDGKTFITDEFNRKNKKSMLKAGDVLLVQSGHIGHSAVVTEEHEGHNCHAMIVISSVANAFLGQYLSLFFNTSGMQQKFQEIRSGSTVPHLTCGEVKELMIPLPDLATQQRLVDHSQELDVEVQRLEAIYQKKLTALDGLKKSLLHQAFSGQL